MNLTELYATMPVGRHGDIRVAGDRVLVRREDQSLEEYLIDFSGELWLVRSDREGIEALAAIKSRLGIAEVGK
ncbi:MAG: hypothetical protein V1894_05985 [Chloroflexota bacterium]